MADGYPTESKGKIVVRPPFQNIVDFKLERRSPTAGSSTPSPADQAMPGAETLPVEVTGVFLDEERRPVAEVSITFISLEGEETYQIFSGPDGRFSLASVTPGRYRALISSPGHVTLELKSVRVRGGIGLDLSLSLVDFPLNFKVQDKDLLPREAPRPLPHAAGREKDDTASAS